MHQACQDRLIDKADMTHKHGSVAHGVQQLHGLNIGHNDVKPHNCLLKHKDKYLQLANLANSTQLKTVMYFTPYLM